MPTACAMGNMYEISAAVEDETLAEIERRVVTTDQEIDDVVRDALEVYLQLENPAEVIDESDAE